MNVEEDFTNDMIEKGCPIGLFLVGQYPYTVGTGMEVFCLTKTIVAIWYVIGRRMDI